MALYKRSAPVRFPIHGRTYQVLPQLDEYPAALLKHLECPFGASLVAGFEHELSLLDVFDLLALVECGSIAAPS